MSVEDLVLLIPPVDLREGEREGGERERKENAIIHTKNYNYNLQKFYFKNWYNISNNFGYYIKNKLEGGLNVYILTNSTNFCAEHIYTCTSVKHIQQSCAH